MVNKKGNIALYVAGICAAFLVCGAAIFAFWRSKTVEDNVGTNDQSKLGTGTGLLIPESSVKKESFRVNTKTDLNAELRNSGLTDKQIEEIKSKIPKKNDKNIVSVTAVRLTGKLSPKEKTAIAKIVMMQLEKSFEKMPENQRSKMREALNSPEGKKALNDSIKAYNTQLNGEQRESADPVFQAILSKLNEIKESK